MLLPFIFYFSQTLEIPEYIPKNKYAQHVPYEFLGSVQEKNKGTMEYNPIENLIEKQKEKIK